jgi:release factor glutamine methyltransferase
LPSEGPRVDDLQPGMTIAAARRTLVRAFAAASLDTPELDARLLVGHGLGRDHAALAAAADHSLTEAQANAIAILRTRRLAREPVARILGCKEFWGLSLKLNADTLVPRPETETVVEAALAAINHGAARTQPVHIADLGTGSGALLLALLSELPTARGIGTDISHPALCCARDNALALGLSARASFVACDYGAALAPSFDLIVSNPPYVRRGDITSLQPEVRAFDPSRALDGGSDGLDGYRAIAADGRRLLGQQGILVLELGAGQLAAAGALFTAAGLALQPPRYDISGVARALVVKALP